MPGCAINIIAWVPRRSTLMRPRSGWIPHPTINAERRFACDGEGRPNVPSRVHYRRVRARRRCAVMRRSCPDDGSLFWACVLCAPSPRRYHPSYWALVFPPGMYGAATFKMRAVVELDALEWSPKITLAIALAAWMAAFVGMLVQGARAALRSRARRT